jgi:hypothetical protein
MEPAASEAVCETLLSRLSLGLASEASAVEMMDGVSRDMRESV